MKTFNVIHQTIFSLILFLGMLSLEANDPSDQQFEYNNLEDRWLLLEDNLEWMYFHKNHVYDFQDSVWRPYTYQYYQISNSAELTIEGVSQTVSFSSSGQPISVFNVNEEYNDQIPDVIPSTEGLSSIFRPEGQILEVQSQGGYFYFHNEDTAYSYPNNSWVTYSYEYFPSSGSAFLYLGAQPEVVEFEDGIPVSGLIVPDSNLLSSFVLPDVSGVYDPHENPFPDSVEINHSSVTAFVGSGDSALFYSFSLEAKQRVFITAKGPSHFGGSYGTLFPVLADPKIRLLNANGDIIVENDDWNTSAQQNFSELNLRINDPTTSTSLDSLESALLLDLEQGSYTLVMSPLEGTQEGKGVLSVSAFGISKISIRAQGEMGNLTHGITLSELSSQTRILASAKGAASLSPKYGITNGMTDPSINIVQYTSDINLPATIIHAENDDWDPQGLPRVLGFERPHGANEAVVAPFLSGGAAYSILIADKGESGIVESSSVVVHEIFNLGPEDVSTGVGTAPESLSGMVMSFNEIVVETNGSETDRGMFYAKFEDDQVFFKEYDLFTNQWFENNSSSYLYTKTDGDTATLSINGGTILGGYQATLFFESDNHGNGDWMDAGNFVYDMMEQGKMYFELSDGFPTVVLPPIQTPNSPDSNTTLITPLDVPWDFRVNRNSEGITFEWENEPGANYNLILYSGSSNLYYGGHYPESANVNFAEFGLSGREPLHGEFWLYDDLTREFIRSTPKFMIFPDFNGEIFRVMIDQHWSQADNQGELEGFTLRWHEYSLFSYLIMDLFNPGGGPYPRPNGEPGDDRIFSKMGEQTGAIHINPFETMISVSLSDYNLKGNELLDVVFWEMNSLDGSEIANSEVMTINLSEWTGIPSAAFVPESLAGFKFRISEQVYHDEYLGIPSSFTERSVTLGLDGSALIDGHPGEYKYTKDDNLGKLQLTWHEDHVGPYFNDGNGSRRLDPYFAPVNVISYEFYFDSEDFGHGSFSVQIDFGDQSESESGRVDFEIIQRGWDVHLFSYDEITELTGLTSIENAVAGAYVLHYSGGENGQSEGYLEPVYEAAYSIFYETEDPEDFLRVDLAKYPEYAPGEFVSNLSKVGYKFYQDYFSLPRKAKEYLELNYRWENGTPIGYWEEERLGYDELGNSEVEYVAHLDSGIQVIFYPNGEFSYEYDPYKRERDAGLTFNSLASNYGSQRLGFWNGVSEGPNPVYVDIRRIDGDVSEHDSLMYRISLLNRDVGEDETPSLEDYDLSDTDFPAGTPVTLTINYESDDPRYFIVSGSEVSGYKNRYPDSWLGTPGSFTIKAKTVDPVASESNQENAFGYDWGDIGSTFSITVQMGAERYYGGAIFETNIIGLDTGFSKLSDPFDQAFSFDLKGLPGTSTKVRALMPKSVLNNQFMIWEATEVKAGIADPENGIRFVRGSRDSDQEALDPDVVGSGFHRILHKGSELDMYMPDYGSIMGPDGDAEFFLADNELFGFESSVLIEDESSQRRSASTGRRSVPTTWSSTETYTHPSLVIDGGYSYISLQDVPAGIQTNNATYWSTLDSEAAPTSPSGTDTLTTPDVIPVSIASRFDFDGDSYADSLVEVTFDAEVFPGDVQIGNPYVDPFKGIDLDKLGSISGTIYNEDGNTLDDFIVEFFTEVNDPFMGVSYREYAMVADFQNLGNGRYEAKLLPGDYQVEAWGWSYDYSTNQNINYRPQIALDASGNPETYAVVDEKDKYSKVDFVLQEEYTISWEQGQVTAQLLNIETPDMPLDVWGAFLDLTPVDPVNTDLALTDYPVWSVHIDYNGSIDQSVPEGTFKVDLVSHGNPMKLDQESKLIWNVKKGEMNDFGVLKVKLQERYYVSGKFTDENGQPVWAEVLFVDPKDEYNYYWPEWDSVGDYNSLTGEWIEPEPGTYSVRIPEGTYKILAREHSGIFSDSYYNGTNFSDAQEVTINEDLTDINFILKEGAVSTFTIRLENKNGEPITGAWFHFYDGENEYGGLSFPQVQEDGLGNYTLKIRPGVYKIQVEGPGYQSFFRIKDDLGNSSWESSFWDKAEPITANSSEIQDLGTVILEEYEHDFGWTPPFWFDDEIIDDPFQSNTISGEVLTDKGAKVPGARIFAHTVDYLIWVEFDQYGQELKSRPDGSYKIENLPDGEWVVFAVPPTESDDFLGLAESDRERKPIAVKNGETKTQNLILRGANVSGRIMYPEKIQNSDRVVSLADANVWVYTANADGLPAYEDNWFFDETTTFIEEFAVTDDKGFFSLNLPQAGNYAVSIFLPQRLSALSTKPIQFRLEDPNKPVKIGNSIRLEWPSQGASKKIDISRKIKDAVESPTSVLEDKLVANTTYYVDTITPGKDYEYKVEAIGEDGKKNTVQDVRTSPPIIFLSSPSNTVKGTVLDTNDREISGAEVEAWRLDGEGWASTSTGTDGTFEFSLGAGEWEIFIYRPYGKNVSWIYEGSPRVVTLTEDMNRELKEPFVVSILSEVRKGSVTGKINFSDFNSSADLTELIFIDVYDPSGRGDSVNPDKDGNFAVYLKPGEYEVSVWVDPSLGGFADYEPEIKRVGKGAIDIGEINFIKFSSTISGKILADNGNPIFGAEVWAWSYEGGWASTTTGRDGSYSLSVSPGRWEVGYDFYYTQGQIIPYIVQPPKRVLVKGEGESKIVNFRAKDAGAVVNGLVTERGNKANINGWVYAKKYEENAYFTDVVAEVPLSNGEFSFPAYEGSYLVGLWLPPGSDYDFPDEKLFHVEIDANGVAVLKDENNTVIKQAVFEISSISSTLSGNFKDAQGILTGLSGEVYAMRTNGSGWRSTEFTKGTYNMSLPEGDWLVDYFITHDDGNNSYPSYPAQPFRVIVNKDTTYNFDLSDVEVISASISGTVRDETGTALKDSMVYVWAFREEDNKFSEFWNEVQTDENGSFSIPVLPGGRYEVGIFIPDNLRAQGYLDSPVQNHRLSKDANVTNVVFDLIMPSEDNYIEGVVVDENENPLEGAYIYAWNHDGLEIDTISDEKGKFKLNTSSGSIWRVGGDYSDYNSSFLIADKEIDIDLRTVKSKSGIEIILKQPDFVLPDSISENFDPKVDFYKQLPDGTEITITAGTLQGIEEVKLVVTPTARIARDADVKTADYAYSLELFNAKTGKKIEGEFEHDVIISVPVDIKSLEDNGVDLDTIEGKYYDATKNAWVSAKTTSFDENSSKLVMTTDHFSSYVVASQSNDSELVGESLSYTEVDNADDWYSSDWFGPFYNAGNSWIYHYQLGWLFTEEQPDGSYWLYHEELKWIWTSPAYFHVDLLDKSYIFSESKGNWLFFEFSNSQTLYWEFTENAEQWTSF